MNALNSWHRMAKRRWIAVLLTGAVALSSVMPAHALFGGRIVFDPTNYVQNTLTAVRTLQQIHNQIKQLQNEAQMLMNQARNLTSLPFDVTSRLRDTLALTAQLIEEAKGLAYDLREMDEQFKRLYPDEYQATVTGSQMLQDAREHWKHTLDGLHTAMRMQAQAVQTLQEDERVITDLVDKSQSAVGALQAMQATNQLLALQAKQSIQVQQLQITQDRAASLELARQAAANERAREVRRRFIGEGTPYTPHAVQFYE